MLDHSQVNYLVVPPVEEKLLLPSMTVAFIDCLPFENGRLGEPASAETETPSKAPAISLVPLGDESKSPSAPNLGMAQDHRCTGGPAKVSAPSHHVVVRHLIQSISHHFNNLLMGIWGNITLLKMGCDKNHPVHHHLGQMEKLIESGAFLTHMVLGYLGERRMVTRRLRLDQIVQELFEATGNDPNCLDRFRLKKRLKFAASIQHPPMIAASTGKVLDLLLRRLGTHRLECSTLDMDSPDLAKKIHLIDGLIAHGHDLVSQLLLYAGERKPEMVPTKLKPVLAEVLHQVAATSGDSENVLQSVPAPSTMLMDRILASAALREILGYLLDDASSHSGIVSPYPENSPSLHIAYHPDQVQGYVTIQAPGHRRSARFWDLPDSPGPFWETPQGDNSKSLALAAAGAVIKAHGGFIQQDRGDTAGGEFQIHLPLMSEQCNAMPCI